MTIDFIKLSPTGNITVLVTTPVPLEQQAATAARLLAWDGVGGEQVGYVEPAEGCAAARLRMMGGEFCGNATMSLGALLARNAGLGDGESMDLTLEVSGSDAPVPCHILRQGDAWIGTVQMPLPTGIERLTLDTDGGPLTVPLVRMPGIAHLILPAEARLDEAQLRRRLPQWNLAIRADALGAITWNAAEQSIDPLVFVPSAGTLVREHGCGSGTAAVGCWLAAASGCAQQLPVRQPGGAITVRTELQNNTLSALTITGAVRLIAEGRAYME